MSSEGTWKAGSGAGGGLVRWAAGIALQAPCARDCLRPSINSLKSSHQGLSDVAPLSPLFLVGEIKARKAKSGTGKPTGTEGR